MTLRDDLAAVTAERDRLRQELADLQADMATMFEVTRLQLKASKAQNDCVGHLLDLR